MSTPLVEIKGFPELEAKIKELADDKKKKAAVTGLLRKVAQVTVKAAKRNAPVAKKPHLVSGKRTRRLIQPGNLSKSIGIIQGRRGKAAQNPTIYVGPRAKGNNLGFYGHMVEYGHNIYRAGFKRQHSASDKAKAHNAGGAKGRTKAIPFMRKTYEQTKGQVTNETQAVVEKYIQQQIDKLSRQ